MGGSSSLEIDGFEVLTENENIDNIRVFSGGTLIINNCVISLPKNGEITLDPGASLTLNNATLTKCNESVLWLGINASPESSVTITNESKIEFAQTGVKLGKMQSDDPLLERASLEINGNSSIENCETGIFLGEGNNEILISNSSLLLNTYGIYCINSSGLKLTNTTFDGGQVGIRILDSSVEVLRGCSFNDCGILGTGTFPLSSNIIVGEADETEVSFTGSKGAIMVESLEHSVGINVFNASFDKPSSGVLTTAGATNYSFQNNIVSHCKRGVWSAFTGDNINKINCNEFNDFDQEAIVYMFDNRESEFLENTFGSTSNTSIDVSMWGADIKDDIGTPDNTAANCFGDASQDFEFVEWSGGEIPSFNYHFLDTIDCLEPLGNDIYELESSNRDGDNCDFARNVFTNIDPDNDGVPGIEYNDSIIIRVGCCLPSIPDSIEKWIDIYADLGGDDPRTQEDDSRTNQQGQTSSGNSSGSSTSSNSSNNNMSLSVAKGKMVNWIDFGVYVSLQNNDRALGESILNNLQAWKYRKMLFGLLVKHRDLIAAQSILSQLPTRNEEESHFKIIQSINMKRLNGLSESNKINETDISMLVVLANSINPSRGYARSVYHSLTGHSLPMEFPSRISGRKTERNNDKSSEILIYPNPFQNQLTISSKLNILSYRILDIDGKLFISGNTLSTDVTINTVNFDVGMYIIEFLLEDGSKISKLINKT